MIAFFLILALLMVLVAATGRWQAGPRRRVIYRDVVPRRRHELIEEEIVDDPYPAPRRRLVRRQRSY